MNPNTTRRWKWLEQGNQNRLCGPLMRSNCCCDSHSTIMRVSIKTGSIFSAAQTQACSQPLLLLLLLWDVMGFRGRRLEVEGWGDGVIILESMQIRHPRENGRLRFRIFPPWDPFSKKCVFKHCVFRISVADWPTTCVFSHKNVKERFCVDGLFVAFRAQLLANWAGRTMEQVSLLVFQSTESPNKI